MSLSDRKLAASIKKMYPDLTKTQINNYVKATKKKPSISITVAVAGKTPKKPIKRKKA
mgnify:CR=1 FL=1|jgi:hypothetical protein|tara:strand:- start:28 stop:201 length:174 start_codon:yes stop_codon:yes gene_type:complete